MNTSELHEKGPDGDKTMKPDHSIHDYDGLAQPIREGAKRTSQLHAQFDGGNYTINPGHSIHDLDGITPSQTYTDIINAQESQG